MFICNYFQKSRLKSLESLRKAKSRSIVVASDVAARGLDIPSVATVIHYDCARAVDTFIHRAGRTAVRVFLSFPPKLCYWRACVTFRRRKLINQMTMTIYFGLESPTFTCGVVAASVENFPLAV